MNKEGLEWIIYRSNQDHNPVPINFSGFTQFRIDHYGEGYAWTLYRENPVPRYHLETVNGKRIFHKYVPDCKASLLWYLENFNEAECMDFVTGDKEKA